MQPLWLMVVAAVALLSAGCGAADSVDGVDGGAESTPKPPSRFVRLLGRLQRTLRTDGPSAAERHMAKNRLILANVAADYAVASAEPAAFRAVRAAFYDEETVAVVHYKQRAIDACRLMEIDDKEHLDEVVGNLTSYMTVQTLPTVAMVNLISRCQRVDRPPLSRSSAAAKGRGDKSSRALKMEPVTPPPMGQSFITAIVPGTKWCGPGDTAQSYDELGTSTEVDKCCRAHDHCPIKVKGMGAGHGLVNLSFYTKSHCACDDEFFSCLRRLNTPIARMIGNIYFNVIQVPCIEEDSPLALPPAKFQVLAEEDLCSSPESRNARSCTSSAAVDRKFFKFSQVNREF